MQLTRRARIQRPDRPTGVLPSGCGPIICNEKGRIGSEERGRWSSTQVHRLERLKTKGQVAIVLYLYPSLSHQQTTFFLSLAPAPAFPTLKHPAAASPASPDVIQLGLCLLPDTSNQVQLSKCQSHMFHADLFPNCFTHDSAGP